jgi:alkanesulfonate monooxygenase SsuD/methylene tetrahydromethanopterin reductase-like flavin-dependent oxidoreductase (luciferase family)
VFSTPWLDGPTALAAVIDRSSEMTLATAVSLPALRGPVPLAKALAALDALSGGRLLAGVGPGSSERDYGAVGMPFHDRWKRFDEAVTILRALLGQQRAPQGTRYFTAPDLALAPRQAAGVPLWIGSWGSAAGLRRVARLGDGWLASAYTTTAEQFVSARALLGGELRRQGRPIRNSRMRG